MLINLSYSLKKSKQLVYVVKKVRTVKDSIIKLINLSVVIHLSPSSKYFGPPKHELWTWEEVENYVKRKQRNKPFLRKLHTQEISFPPPLTTIGKPEPGAEIKPKVNFSYCEYVCGLPNARVSMKDFHIITEDDYLIQPLSNYYDGQSRSHVLYTKIKLPAPEKLTGKTLVLKGVNNDYYHIMHDAVCAIKLTEDAGIDLHSIDNFLIFDFNEDWYRKVYLKLGLPKHKFINAQGKNAYVCEQLIIASYFEHHGTWYSDFLKKTFLPEKLLQTRYGKRLYISRARALKRRIVNEEEVVSFLNTKGFSVVFAEDLSIEEQASVYNEAECIVSVHGANLVNILFCKPGTKICEIRYSKHAMYYKKLYYEMAMDCKLQYYLLYSSEGRLSTSENVFDSDVYVNINDLNTMLSSMEC